MIRFLKRFFFFIAILYIFNLLISLVLKERVVLDKNEKLFWLFQKKEEHYNYGFLGSSRVHYCIDINHYKKLSNSTAINLGNSGSGYIENYMTLIQMLENGNSFDTIIIQLDHNSIHHELKSYNFYFLPFANSSEMKESVRDNSNELNYYLWKYVPFSYLMEFNEFYFTGEAFFKCDFDTTGGSYLRSEKLDLSRKPKVKKYLVDQRAKNYLSKIINLCQENGMNIVFYTAPYFSDILFSNTDISNVQFFIDSLTTKTQIPYFNYLDVDLAKDTSNFYNYSHLNRKGATILTERLYYDIQRQ